MPLKTVYSVDDTYDVHAEADKVFVDILTTMEEPYELTLEAVGDLINALEMAYSDAVDLKEAEDQSASDALDGLVVKLLAPTLPPRPHYTFNTQDSAFIGHNQD